jgi:hypothetical protein
VHVKTEAKFSGKNYSFPRVRMYMQGDSQAVVTAAAAAA